ncbi:MAG: hypothetical protein RL748_4477 [Pseudomonadota bacterium]|jgi:hypothetical protein
MKKPFKFRFLVMLGLLLACTLPLSPMIEAKSTKAERAAARAEAKAKAEAEAKEQAEAESRAAANASSATGSSASSSANSTPVVKTDPEIDAAVSKAAMELDANVSSGLGIKRQLNLSFRQMGHLTPIKLRGVDGSASLPFSIRSDEVVVGAKLKFEYHYSPSLIPELSHLQVMLNEEIVAVYPLPKDKNLKNQREIEIDPRLFTDYNKLRFALIGHYTYKCEDPMHTSLWLNLSTQGKLELALAPLAQTNDLKYLPVPFFDKRDNNALRLPFVFAGQPSFTSLKAAGIVASWFGGLASYRGSEFPVSIDTLPPGNAVVVLQGNEKIGAFTATNSAGVSIITHPTNPNAKLLIVSGKNEDDLLRAARAIALDHTTLRGQRVTITQDNEPPPRKPYDAPSWVPSDKPVPFGTLAKLDELQVKGYFPDLIRVNFRVAPDLFTWRSSGVPMELKYRFTRMPFSKNSSLNISVNRNFVQALSLAEPGKKMTATDLLKLPVLDNSLVVRKDLLFVPPYQVGERNQLQLHYYFDVTKEGECRDGLPDNLEAAIDPESTIDFSGFPHYAALPNLAFFANIGYPYTKLADLSETAVVLPDRPDAHEVGTYLMLMGRMGEATGYPALRHQVITASQVDKSSERDLIVIGSQQSQSLMEKWADHWPMVQSKGERRVREPDVFRRPLYRWEGEDVQNTPRPNANLSLRGASNLSAMMAIESPLTAKRSVVFLYADKSSDLAKIGRAMRNPELVPQVQGDFVVIDDAMATHAKVGETYYVGSLPWSHHLRWFFSNHPIMVGSFVLLLSLVLAVLAYRVLRRVAAKRLANKK